MTETTGAGTFLAPADHDRRTALLRSCGMPWPTLELRIVDDDGNDAARRRDRRDRDPVAADRHGGLLEPPEATAEAIDADGWLHTGDAGFIDDDGYLFVHDRVKDMIVSGGENVYPAEVENAILGHPGVADAAVIGVPDERWGEAVKAIVVLKPGADQAEDIIAYAGRASPATRRRSRSTSSTPCPATPRARSCAANCASPIGGNSERRVN